MADDQTLQVYERSADAWIRRAADRYQGHYLEHVAWVEAERKAGPVVDIGCGPGWHLANVAAPAIALDGARAMLRHVPGHAPEATAVQALADALPFAPGSVGGAIVNRVLVHLPPVAVPAALAQLHRALAADAPAYVAVFGDIGLATSDSRDNNNDDDNNNNDDTRRVEHGPFSGRLFSGWDEQRLRDVCEGAGFAVERARTVEGTTEWSRIDLRLRRRHTLADTVGADMRLLICGLNPSPTSAEAGVGFARPGNRFWPAALAAGLVSRDRDPTHALQVHGLGMTDLVKRPTRQAAELDDEEYRAGLTRVERLVEWLKPNVVCFVGLAGWRAAVDRKAKAGVQDRSFGGRPVHLMPSTSGLNAHARLDDLVDHLRAADELADLAVFDE